MSDFADLISQAAPNASRREIARKTGVAPETINRIMRGEGDPDSDTVEKIAHALKINVQKARASVAKPRGEKTPYQPPTEANLLDDRQRRAVDELIRSIVAAKGSRHGVEATPQPRTPGEAAESEKTQAADGRDQRQADHDLAARDTGGVSEGEQTRRDMDQQGEAPDPEGPEDGA